jgi:VWFA-related protein
MKRMVVAVSAAAFLTPAATGRGQTSPPLPPRPTFEAGITVVSLPVYVTDSRGRSVTGLRAEDFAVEDSGRPVRLVGFREIDAGEVADDSAPLPPEARRQFLLLFDLSFTSVGGLMRSRQAAQDFIRSGLGPSDLASVATFSATHGLSMLTGFTSDRVQLKRAVDSLGVLQRDRAADPLGLAYDLTEVGAALMDTIPEDGMVADAVRSIQIRYQRSQEIGYRQRILALLEAMSMLAKALDSVQGRKQVVFLSNGFDDTALVGEQGRQAQQDAEAISRGRVWEVPSESRFGDSQVRQVMTEMLRSFSSADAVVHSVDLTGLSARGDARSQSTEPALRSGRESLAEIANLSGGRLFKDVNDVSVVFRELSEMSRRYYVLAFEPEGTPRPGRFHKLKVKVRMKGTSVSHRSGYYERVDFQARSPLARRFEAAELIEKGGPPGDIPLSVLAMPYVRSGGKVSVPVVLEADGRALLKGARERLSLELYGYAIAEGGEVRDFIALTSNFDLAKVGSRLEGGGLQAHATFTLQPGTHSLRFLIRDAVSGRSATHWMEVTIPDLAPAEVVLLPPLFMDDPERWLIMHAASRATGNKASSPFQVAQSAFTPRPRPTLANGREQRVCLLALDGNRQYDAGASFEIVPALLDQAGSVLPFGDFRLMQAVAGEDGYRRFVLAFTPTGIGSGDYRLRVRVRDPSSGRVGESFQSVRVE